MEEQQSIELTHKIINSKDNIREEEYRPYPAVNYSTLSRLSSSPSSVNRIQETTESMTLGSIVDNLLTKGSYGEEYTISQVDKPSGQMGEFCDALWEEKLADNPVAMEVAYDVVGFKRDKLETVMKKYMEGDGVKYLAQLSRAQGKTLVSMDMISKATEIKNRVLSTPVICDFFKKDQPKGIEVLYQVPIVFDLPEGMGKGKALIDIVVLNHNDETMELYDLKTTGDSSSRFRSSFMKWKYYLQASFYYYGMKSISKYDVKGFNFITVSTTHIEPAVIWKCTPADLMVGMNGIERPSSHDRVKGWKELVTDLKWHTDNDSWTLPRYMLEEDFQTLGMFSKWEK
jgi:hypothetical protein